MSERPLTENRPPDIKTIADFRHDNGKGARVYCLVGMLLILKLVAAASSHNHACSF